MTPRLRTEFLGWDGPALPAAASRLLDARHLGGPEPGDDRADPGDLSRVIVAVPGKRAARGLLGYLARAASQRNIPLVPPTPITPGELPATLLGRRVRPEAEGGRRPAAPLATRAAWIRALRESDRGLLAALLPRPPDDGDAPSWSRVAALLQRASDDLAAALLRPGEVPQRLGGALPPEEAPRWAALEDVRTRAVSLLEAHGLFDENDAFAEALRQQDADGVTPEAELVLVAVPELTTMERSAIEAGARACTAMVYAPPEMAGRFDELGGVLTEHWSEAGPALEERRVRFVDETTLLADASLAAMADEDGSVDTTDRVLAVADPEVWPALRRRAGLAAGASVRSPTGTPVLRTPPGLLLTLVREHAEEPSLSTLAALIRHPDVEAALRHANPPVPAHAAAALLDEIAAEHVGIDPRRPPDAVRDVHSGVLSATIEALDRLLGPLAGTGRAGTEAWSEAVAAALAAVYGGKALRPDDEDEARTIGALEKIRSSLDGLAAADAVSGDEMDAASALGLLLTDLEGESVPEPRRDGSIETIGWLELALDPSPACVVAGLDDTRVPGSITHDPLLPDSARRALGLRTNEDRLARDAFLLAAIDATRDAVYIASRRRPDGSPATPSRLLFRSSGADLARRVRRLTRPERDDLTPARLASRTTPGRSGGDDPFVPPLRVDPGYRPPGSMSVTEFGAYLRSPAGWYLERHLGLGSAGEAVELSPMAFGDLAHRALERFGADERARDLADPDRIAEALHGFLDEAVRDGYGEAPPATVRLQIEMLRRRLECFAEAQAERRASGWVIARAEWSPPDASQPPGIDAEGGTMPLRGRIDRIDLHERDGRVALIDYKTNATPREAEDDHVDHDGVWRSLQLPLYRHLAAPLLERIAPAGFDPDNPDALSLGYARLPAELGEGSAWSFATWDRASLADADDTARWVIERIRDLEPGSELEPGDHPPDEGALGWACGARFDPALLAAGAIAGEAAGDEP